METKEQELQRKMDVSRWIIGARTKLSLAYPITGVSFSPVRQDCIVLYTKLPEEVAHLPMPKRQRMLDLLGVDEPHENVEDDYPLIIVNKTAFGAKHAPPMQQMAYMNRYSFYRNFRRHALKNGVDLKNPRSAYHLIGKKIKTDFFQFRKANTDVRIWSPDRVGMSLEDSDGNAHRGS